MLFRSMNRLQRTAVPMTKAIRNKGIPISSLRPASVTQCTPFFQSLQARTFMISEENKFNHTFNDLPEGAPDVLLSLAVQYREDSNPNKTDLGIGAYRTDAGVPKVFEVVKKAERMILEDDTLNKEYPLQEGSKEFARGARGALLGWNHPDVDSGRIATAQTLSGNGALRMLTDFIKKYCPAPVYVSDPTWSNHEPIVKESNLIVRRYRYYNPETKAIDMSGLTDDLANAQPGSWVLFHACAHNPTGVDPTQEQWKEIVKICKRRKLRPFFDTAYQGFVSGCMEKDGSCMRFFLEEGMNFIAAQSFAKTLGLYGERVGALHIVCDNKETAENTTALVRAIIRTDYSFPPLHGNRLCTKIFSTPELRDEWAQEIMEVHLRIDKMRNALRDRLVANGCPGNWDHIVNQCGMFSFTGLTPAQCYAMVHTYSVYMMDTGRISISGMNSSNVDYVANCIQEVVSLLPEEEEVLTEHTSEDEDGHYVSIEKVTEDFIDMENPKLNLFKLLSSHIRTKKFLIWSYGEDDPATGAQTKTAKKLLDDNMVDYDEVCLAFEDEKVQRIMKSALVTDSGQQTLPNIYYKKEHIGGIYDLKQYMVKKNLVKEITTDDHKHIH